VILAITIILSSIVIYGIYRFLFPCALFVPRVYKIKLWSLGFNACIYEAPWEGVPYTIANLSISLFYICINFDWYSLEPPGYYDWSD